MRRSIGWFQALLARFPVRFLSKRLAFWLYDHADKLGRQGRRSLPGAVDVNACEVFMLFYR